MRRGKAKGDHQTRVYLNKQKKKERKWVPLSRTALGQTNKVVNHAWTLIDEVVSDSCHACATVFCSAPIFTFHHFPCYLIAKK